MTYIHIVKKINRIYSILERLDYLYEINYLFLCINNIIQIWSCARLSIVDEEQYMQHVVLVVFVFEGNYYYIPIDKKSKKTNTRKTKKY